MGVKGMSGLDKFHKRLVSNIRDDFFDVIAVTSRSSGKIPSEGRPYRVGKSTFAMWLSALAHYWWYQHYGKRVKLKDMWEEVFEHLFYDLYDVEQYIKRLAREGKTIPAIVWDEAERSAPAYQHIPNKMRKAIYNINTYGTAVKFLIVTCPAISDLAKPLRKMVSFEVIIPKRGHFEVQFIRLRKKFRSAPDELSYYEYWGEGTFPPLPPDVQRRYDEWRKMLPSTEVKGYGDDEETDSSIEDVRKFLEFSKEKLEKLYKCAKIEEEPEFIGRLSWWRHCFPNELREWVPIDLIARYLFGDDKKARVSFQSKAVRMCNESDIECRRMGRYLFVRPGDFAKLIASYVVMSDYMRALLPSNVSIAVKRARR